MENPKPSTSRRGTAIVETALILPLLLILTFGGIKYGWLFIKWQQVTNVVRHSARYASTYPTPTSPSPSDLIDSLMNGANMPNYSINQLTIPGTVGGDVVVEIEVDAASVDILRIALLPAPSRLVSRMTLSKEGP